MSEGEIYNRLWRQDRTARRWQLALALAAAAVMTAGYYQGRDMAVLVSEGERVQGTVTRMNSRIERTEGGSRIFYSPVFTFTALSGSTHRLEDKGSTMPIFRIGDSAAILYHPRNPENAIVDQGLLNWALPGGFFLGGLVVLGAVVKSYAGVRRRARMLREAGFAPQRA